MKKNILYVLVLVALMLQTNSAQSCTGFIVDGEDTIYGMNFDFYTDDIRFFIEESGGMKIFYMAFGQDDYYVPTVGMNSEGVFASLQELYPVTEVNRQADENQEFVYMLFYDALYQRNLDLAVQNAKEREIINGDVSIHLLMGDHHGKSYVVEPGIGNVFPRENPDYHVMTNFSHAENQGLDRIEVQGVGSDRYRYACDVIEEAGSSFTKDDAFKTLKKSAQLTGSYRTQSSLVFDPDNTLVYVSLKGDFTKKWKIDMNEKTIETYSGYDGYSSYELSEEGVHMDELVNPVLKPVKEKNEGMQPILIISGIGAVLVVTIIWIIASRKH